MPYFSIDESAWPLVRMTFEGTPSDADFEAYLSRMEKLYERPGKRALMFDSRRTENLKAAHRQRQAEWIKKHSPIIRDLCAGMAFVISSTLVRGILTAILWMQPLPCPHVVCETPEQAERWLRERLSSLTA